MNMTFEQFRTNVEAWAAERGIYEHSTALAQALKAVSEAGELCDAVIKNDRPAMIDAIGDVAVCIVNFWKIHAPAGKALELTSEFESVISLEHQAASIAESCALLAKDMARDLTAWSDSEVTIYLLQEFCLFSDLDFLHCCESAWQEIKDRKGRMVAGGAFVKE